MSRTLTAAALLTAFVALNAAPAHADYEVQGTRGTTTKDEGLAELYADAIEDYGGSGDLSLCIDGTEKWIDHLDGAGYSNWGFSTDEHAFSWDYEDAHNDDIFNDSADFSYFSGHGNTGAMNLHGLYGDNWVNASETRLGNQDLEVLAIDACQTLNATGRTQWINANRNDGVHWILGFHTNAVDITTTADKYGLYLSQGYDVDLAWMWATRAGHGSDRTGGLVRFYNSSCDTYWDDIHNLSCDPTSNAQSVEVTWTL